MEPMTVSVTDMIEFADKRRARKRTLSEPILEADLAGRRPNPATAGKG